MPKIILALLITTLLFSGCSNNSYTSDQQPETKPETESISEPKTLEEPPRGYSIENNTVYWNNRISYDLSVLPEADAETFQELNEYFGKDKNYVYGGYKKLEGADPETFQIIKIPGILEWACGQDKNRTYKHPYLLEDNQGNPIDDECNVIK